MATYKDVAMLNDSMDSLTRTLLQKKMMQQQREERDASQRTADERTGIERQQIGQQGEYQQGMLKAAQGRMAAANNGYFSATVGITDPTGKPVGSMFYKGPWEGLLKAQQAIEADGLKTSVAPPQSDKAPTLWHIQSKVGDATTSVHFTDERKYQEAVAAIKTASPEVQAATSVKPWSVTLPSGKTLEGVEGKGGAYQVQKPEKDAATVFEEKVADSKLRAVIGQIARLESDLQEAQARPGNEPEAKAIEQRLLQAQMRLDALKPGGQPAPPASAGADGAAAGQTGDGLADRLLATPSAAAATPGGPPDLVGRMAAAQRQGGGASPQEVPRRTKDGRIAIYDAATKKFLRYAE